MTTEEMIERYRVLQPDHISDLSFIREIKKDGEWYKVTHDGGRDP